MRAQGIGTYGTLGRNGRHRSIEVSNISNPNGSVTSSRRLPHEQARNRPGLANESVYEIAGVFANMSHLGRFYRIIARDVVVSQARTKLYTTTDLCR